MKQAIFNFKIAESKINYLIEHDPKRINSLVTTTTENEPLKMLELKINLLESDN